MPAKARTWTLSIFLLKTGVSKPAHVFKRPSEVTVYPIKLGTKELGDLYVEASTVHPASWLAFFAGKLPKNIKLLSASSAGVFVIPVSQRHFALTFGQGRHLLAPGAWEENFGLRVTLNSIDPEQILSLDRKSLDATGRHTREQTGRAANIAAFGINIEQDLLRAITGTPVKAAVAKRMSGADALTIAAEAQLSDLLPRLEQYRGLYFSVAYRKHFAWVDHIAQVKDAALKDELDVALQAELQRQQPTAWLAPPDLVHWEDVAGFRYRNHANASTFATLELMEYFAEKIDDPTTITMERVKRDHVGCVSLSTDTISEAWTVYRCLNTELTLHGKTYLLSNGSWYRIDTNFVQQVDAHIAAIPLCALHFPGFQDQTEGAYSARVAKNDKQFVLLDKKTVQYGGGRSRIEICDLYHSTRRFIHLKPYSGSEALSHLFNQGVVSGTLFQTEEGFRDLVNTKLPLGRRITNPAKSPSRDHYEVVFAIIDRRQQAGPLPFFSKVSLRNAHRMLTGYGYKVTTATIRPA